MGYVEGGMGQISFAIAQAARDLGAELATGVPVAEILPGEGGRLEGGELIRAATVVSNADPKRTLGLVDPAAVPGDFRSRVDAWQIRSPVVKLNAALDRLPTFPAAAGSGVEAHRAMVDVTRGLDAAPSRPSRTPSAGFPTSASARSTSRPPTTPRSPRRAGTWSACSPSTRRTSWPRATGTAAGPRSAG